MNVKNGRQTPRSEQVRPRRGEGPSTAFKSATPSGAPLEAHSLRGPLHSVLLGMPVIWQLMDLVFGATVGLQT